MSGIELSAAPLADVEAASTYHVLFSFSAHNDAAPAGTRLIVPNAATTVLAAQAGAGAAVFQLDPADYVIGSKTLKARLRLLALANDTASTSTFTLGLYPVSAPAGAAATIAVTLGTVVAGSAPAALVAPAANSVSAVSGSDFAFPAAGQYAFAVVIAGSMVANSSVQIRATLAVRAV